MGVVQDISTGLGKEDYLQNVDESRGVQLERELIEVCEGLGRVGDITEGKADVEFLLNIVAAYLISKSSNRLGEDAKSPQYIFDENLFPAIDNMEDVIKEKIEEDEDGDTTIT